MKLRLPKVLLSAVAMAFAVAPMYAETETDYTPEVENPEYMEEGEPVLLSADGKMDIGKANLDAWLLFSKYTGGSDLVLGQDETMGVYDANGNLIKSGFGTHTEKNPNTSALITNKVVIAKNFLSSKKNLTLNANAIVALGGEYDSEYIGLSAKDVTINGTAELILGRLDANSLIATGASTVSIHTTHRGGNTIGNSDYSKQTKIDGAISVKQGANVTIGVDNGQNGNNSYNEQFLNYLGGTITQDSQVVLDETDGSTLSTGSTLLIKGRTYISGNLNITQSGGNMEIALWHRNPAANSTGNVPSILRLGKTSNNKITQTTAGTMKIGQIACGNNGNSNSQISIEQQGSGSIELVNGVAFTTGNQDSSIKQTSTVNNGTIKLSGDFSSARFDITQEGNGKIDLNGTMRVDAVTQTAGTLNIGTTDKDGNVLTTGNMTANSVSIGGTLNVVDGASLKANTITVTDNGSMNVANLNVDGTLTNNGSVQATGTVTATGTVDNKNNMDVQTLVINSGTTTNAKGATLTAGSITVNEGATLINHGTISSASGMMLLAEGDDIAAMNDATSNLITIAGGKMEQYGVTTSNILVQNGGTLTLAPMEQDGAMVNARVGAVTLQKGANLSVTGDVQTGALTLEGGTITFELGASLKSDTVTGLDTVEIKVSLSDAALADIKAGNGFELELFTNSTGSSLAGATVNFVSTSGGKAEATVKQDSEGKVTIGQLVPEPTTATLSLLALAALAARRRRAA